MNRQERLNALRQRSEVTVLIVGGGINGVGLFRDLALQGVKVLLVEKGDFCSGASAASSHMIHGGIRYLENGEFRLVREALTERNLLLQNAPHYVHPLPTTIPIFEWLSGLINAGFKFVGLSKKSSRRGALMIKLGLLMYDWYARAYRTMPRHSFFSRSQSRTLRPRLNPHIVGTALYYDAWMSHPERLCLELLLDTEASQPDNARALNYVSVQGAQGDIVFLRDERSGDSLAVQPEIVVNATGAWIDFTNQALHRRTHFIGGTKGSHLLLDHPELYEQTQGQMVFYETPDGRIELIFPYFHRVMIGTTDIPITNPDEAVCTDEEIDYLFHSVNHVFPDIHLAREQIVFQFSGVRPLPQSDASTPGQVSRDHSVKLVPPGDGVQFPTYNLIGGKWTTFRAFSEQVADTLLAALHKSRQTDTQHLPIGGGKDYPASDQRAQWINRMASETGVSADRVTQLFERYGTRAEAIAHFIAQTQDDAPLNALPDYSRREILFLAQHEHVVHLDDLVRRRTVMAMLGQVTYVLLDELATIIAPALGWIAADARREIERSADILRTRHGVTEDQLQKT